MNNVIKRVWNKNTMVNIEDLQGMAFQAESEGHTFQISGIDGEGNTVALYGTPAGVMLRADGQDVPLTCSVSGGVVSATLPANAYSVPGRFGLKIFLTSDGQKTAIYAAVGTVGKTSSGTVAPPAGSDVVDLVNAIATAVATIPASYTDLMASVAPTYSSSGLYAVGSYAWYNGKLYRCTTPITSGETWTSGHWTPANLGSDLVDLKSALNLVDNYLTVQYAYVDKPLNDNGTLGSDSTTRIATDTYIPSIAGETRVRIYNTANNRSIYAKVVSFDGYKTKLAHDQQLVNPNEEYIFTIATNGYIRIGLYYQYEPTLTEELEAQLKQATTVLTQGSIAELNAFAETTGIALKGTVGQIYLAHLDDIGFDKRVAFFAKSGDSISVKTDSGDAFTSQTINFYDKNGDRVSYWTISGNSSPKTITIPNDRADIYFCAIIGGTAQATTVINNSNKLNQLDKMSAYGRIIPQIIKTVIMHKNTIFPCYAEKNDLLRFETLDGSNFIGTTASRIQFYDVNMTAVSYFGLGSNYGKKRDVTYTNDTPAYYASINEENAVIVLRSNSYQTTYSSSIVAKYVNDDTFNDRKNVEQNSTKQFIFFSDIHSASTDMNRIVEFANKVGSIDAVINGGDTVQQYVDENVDWYNTAVGNCSTDVLMAIGNHDMWESDHVNANPVTVYNKFIAPIVINVNDIVQPSNASTNGLCYYYKDYGSIRVIVLSAMSYEGNSMQWDSDQLDWLQSVLSNAKSNGKSVICVNHSPFSKATAEIDYSLPLNSWQKFQTWPTMDNIYVNRQAVSAVNDYIAGGGSFICWLTGHEHRDFLMTDSEYENQFMINIASAKYNLRHDGVNASSTDERNYDCFDYIGIDATNSIIKVWRIGYNQDASMKIRNRFSYDYANNKLLAYS